MKYLVMERHESYVVVLDEQGRFFKVANMDYFPGQTLTKVIPMEDFVEKRKKRAVFFSLFLAVVLLFAFGIYFFFFSSSGTDSVVFRINMGGEIAVTCDRKNNVTKIEGKNPEGEILAQDVDFNNKSIKTVSAELLEKSVNMGFIGKDEEIFLSIEGIYDDDKERLESLGDFLEDYAEDRYDIEVEKCSWEEYSFEKS